MVAKPMVNSAGTLADVIDRILDKGLVINADITVAVVGVELLGVKIRAALASFETAARYGLEFPSGANLATPAWQAALAEPRGGPGYDGWPSVNGGQRNGANRKAQSAHG